MKKTFKRAGVAVLSMAMLLSMGAIGSLSASAAKDNTTEITVAAPASSGAAEATYTIYKVCDATPTSSGTAYSYTMAAGYESIDVNEVLDCGDTATAKKALADKLAGVSGVTSVATVKSGNSVKLMAGYYLAIMDPTGTTMTAAPILFSIDSEANAGGITLSAKTSEVDVVKTIEAVDKGSVASGQKDAEGAIGAVVDYKVVSTIPNYAETVDAAKIEYALIDVPSAGLTIQPETVVVNGNSGALTAADCTLTATATKIKVKFDGAYIKANGGNSVTMTYKATINEHALVSTDDVSNPNPNTVTLYYDNDYYTASKTGNPTDGDTPDPGDLTEKEDKTDVYTTKLVFKKLFGGIDNPIEGATFTFTGEGVNKTITTSSTKNEFTFNGLQAGTYTLTEIAAPGGYVKNDTPITIKITANTEATDVYTFAYTGAKFSSGESFTMDNTPKSNLPLTGGMGTVLFTVGGAAVVLLAGFLFVLYMKKRETEE